MGRPHPPTPLPARRTIRAARLGLIPVIGVAIIAAVLAWAEGHRSLGGWIVVGIGLFGITVASLPRWYWVIPAAMGSGVVLWGVRDMIPSPITIMMAILVFVVLIRALFPPSGLPREMTPESIRRAPDDAIGEGSEEFIRAFEELGYTRIGAIAFPVMSYEILETIMIGPDRGRFAEVTDAVVTVISRFGDHLLVTRNSAVTTTPAHVLTNDVRGGAPHELDSEHDRALTVIASFANPDHLDPGTLVDHAIDQERATIEWMRSGGVKVVASRSGLGRGPLADDPQRVARIESWWTHQAF